MFTNKQLQRTDKLKGYTPMKKLMKNKGFIVSSLLALFMLVAGLVVPANLGITVPAQAAPGVLQWSIVDTPGSFINRADIVLASEVNKLIVGPRTMMLAIVTRFATPSLLLYASGDYGRSWGTSGDLTEAMTDAWGGLRNVWNAAIAPDDYKFWAIVSSDGTTDAPVEVWVTRDAGRSWELTRLSAATGGGVNNAVAAISISPLYNGKRDIAVGIRNGGAGVNAAMQIWAVQSTTFSSWKLQTVLPSEIAAGNNADVIDLKFSPTYAGDASLAVVFSDADQTFFNVAIRDINKNDILSWAFSSSVEIKDPFSPSSASPGFNTIVTADLELPSDFSGQSPSTRRAYVSIDALAAGTLGTDEEGIYRIDDAIVYELMDTTAISYSSIASIAYFGTYASGKLLAGEVYGYPCTATVPTWFTDSPTVCPIPCWYPALKPTTGAANQGTWSPNVKNGQGNAQVAWSETGSLALAATGSSIRHEQSVTHDWWQGFPATPIPYDESAFAISRNNGETWNQLSLIDTTITQFTDVAPSPDCRTIYLASVNNWNVQGSFDEFDSVWRSSINSAVTAPLSPTPPVGLYWERVSTRVTALSCTEEQTDLALLRLPPPCDEPTGQNVFWAAWHTRAVMWSPDFGDYWANVNTRLEVQDMAAESATILYILQADGLVQRLPYTGTAWSSVAANGDSFLNPAHTIDVMKEGKVLVGVQYLVFGGL